MIADDAPDENEDIPPEHQFNCRIELPPEAWTRFCELVDVDDPVGAHPVRSLLPADDAFTPVIPVPS
jgi:hypothetical protein